MYYIFKAPAIPSKSGAKRPSESVNIAHVYTRVLRTGVLHRDFSRRPSRSGRCGGWQPDVVRAHHADAVARAVRGREVAHGGVREAAVEVALREPGERAVHVQHLAP